MPERLREVILLTHRRWEREDKVEIGGGAGPYTVASSVRSSELPLN